MGGTEQNACPIDHSKYSTRNECPIDTGKQELNPNNNMPVLSQSMADGQLIKLSTEREASNIPKSSAEKNHVWEYPSSQVTIQLK